MAFNENTRVKFSEDVRYRGIIDWLTLSQIKSLELYFEELNKKDNLGEFNLVCNNSVSLLFV